jgi:hypothetical protein
MLLNTDHQPDLEEEALSYRAKGGYEMVDAISMFQETAQ